jgi:hypothetical protein
VKKYIVHFIIWGLGIISYYILDKTTAGDEFQNISLLLIGCLMFYAVYYISMISEIKKIEYELNESGIFGGRGMGILINMFSLQYIFELYKKPLVCIVLIVVSVIVLILSRKYIKSFWTKNIWSRQFLLIFIAFNVLASSIGSVLGYKWDDILLVNVENVSNVTKLILIIFYIVIFKNTELPNSFFIRFASKNEALLDRKN